MNKIAPAPKVLDPDAVILAISGGTLNRLASALSLQQFEDAATLLRSLPPSLLDGSIDGLEIVSLWETIHAGRRKTDLDRLSREAVDAEQAEKWPEAIALWTDLKARGFEPRSVALGLARCLSAAGLHDRADRVLSTALVDQPHDTELLVGRAKLASSRGDAEGNAERWRDVMRLSADAKLFSGVAAMGLLEARDLDGAASLLDHALGSAPDNLELLVPRAVVAEHAEDWDEAVRCWTKAAILEPDNTGFRELLGRARWLLSVNDEILGDDTTSASAIPDRIDQPVPTQAELMSAFENLCGNCELGLVQRQFGVDPVGLFRFSEVHPERMEDLLRAGFAQLGDPEHTVIKIEQDEYIMLDDRGYFLMHTLVKTNQVNADKHLKQQNARITLLRRKLLSDLRAGTKIFVCKEPAGNISDDSLFRLSALVSTYSDATILGIRGADPHNRSGSVARLSDRIIIGYVSSLFGAGAGEIDFPAWQTMLEAAYRSAKLGARSDRTP